MDSYCSSYINMLCDVETNRLITPPPLPQDIVFHAATFSNLFPDSDGSDREANQTDRFAPTEDRYIERPKHSFLDLVIMAIKGFPNNEATLQEIYDFISTKFPFFQGNRLHWKNSVRHNLTVRKCFQRLLSERSPSKGVVWQYNEHLLEESIYPNDGPTFSNLAIQLTPPATPEVDMPPGRFASNASYTQGFNVRTQLFLKSPLYDSCITPDNDRLQFATVLPKSVPLNQNMENGNIQMQSAVGSTTLPPFGSIFCSNAICMTNMRQATSLTEYATPARCKATPARCKAGRSLFNASCNLQTPNNFPCPQSRPTISPAFLFGHNPFSPQSPLANHLCASMETCSTGPSTPRNTPAPKVPPWGSLVTPAPTLHRSGICSAGEGNTLPPWAFDFPLMYMPPPVTRF